MKILIIGYSTRYIAHSARRAGHEVYAIDAFGDVDMLSVVNEARIFSEEPTQGELCRMIDSFNIDFDGIVLGSGFEYMDDLPYDVLGNSPEISKRASDKSKISQTFKQLGIPYPESFDSDFVRHESFDRYPVIVKPSFGGGGLKNTLIKNRDELVDFCAQCGNEKYVFQEYVPGKTISVSVISTHDAAKAIAVNEQLVGIDALCSHPFGYCGNITPHISKHTDATMYAAEQIILSLGLIGSNGVDFIETDNGIYAIEVNPRFQGSLDTVEAATGLNVFDLHVKAVSGSLCDISKPQHSPHSNHYSAKAIVYARSGIRVHSLLGTIEGVVDIPKADTWIEKDTPITTALVVGNARSHVVDSLKRMVKIIRTHTQD